MGNFIEPVIKYTAENSHFEKKRDYVSISHIHMDVKEIMKFFEFGFIDSTAIRLKCYKGYQMEEDMIKRFVQVYGDRIKTKIEYSNGKSVKGHPDFEFDGFPADCKSVLKDEWLPVNNKVSRKIYWQMNGYMLLSNSEKSLVVYESRESGKMIEVWLRANKNILEEIENKIATIEHLIKNS